jgi:hypothetical protein
MTIYPSATSQATSSIVPTVHLSDVHIVQSTTLKGTQQSRGKGKKGKDNKEGGGNKNNQFDAKYGGPNKESKKVNLPCKICLGDVLTN